MPVPSEPTRVVGRRILVIGAPGSGKSTLARTLGEGLGLRVIHFDQLYWTPGWTARRSEDMGPIVAGVVAGDDWIFDGNNSRTLPLRAARADTLIWLDLPRRLCFARVLRRTATSYGRVRPDMAAGCPERFDLTFLRWAWTFPHHSRPAQADFFAASPIPFKHRLTRPSEVRALLSSVERASPLRFAEERIGEAPTERP